MGDRVITPKIRLGKPVNGKVYDSTHNSIYHSAYYPVEYSVNKSVWESASSSVWSSVWGLVSRSVYISINNSTIWDIEL